MPLSMSSLGWIPALGRVPVRGQRGAWRVRATPSGVAVKLVATDVDGTLLDSRHCLPTENAMALRRCQDEYGIEVVIATGKARGPWAKDVLPALGLGQNCTAIFLQGLYVTRGDEVVYERPMDKELLTLALEFHASHAPRSGTVALYCGTEILCDTPDAQTDRLLPYGEPVPSGRGNLLENVVGVTPVHKLLFLGLEEDLAALRPALELALGDRATVVKAIDGMLEVLPPGASKGAALRMLLADRGLDPAAMLALGDGENDVEMLRLAGVGVAMKNAVQAAKDAADIVLDQSNDEAGVEAALERFVFSTKPP